MFPATRQQGINALLALQGFIGMAETVQQAEVDWDAMSLNERQEIMAVYRAVNELPPKLEITHTRIFLVDAHGTTAITSKRVIVG